MKKIIAIILAALMLTSVIMIAASAETADAWETLAYKHGFNVYVGAPTDTPPVIDGVIEDGEYSHSMYTSVRDILPLDDRTPAVNGGAAEYFAYDAEYVYYAAKFQQRKDGRSFWLQWKVENRFDIFYDDVNDMTNYYYNRTGVRLTLEEDGGLTSAFEAPEGSYLDVYPTTDEILYAASKTVDEEMNSYTKIYEVRIARSFFARAGGYDASALRVIPYMVCFDEETSISEHFMKGLDDELAEMDERCLDGVTNGRTYRFIVLDESPYPEEKDWNADMEALTYAHGLNLYIGGPVENAPTVDGVVSDGEYSYSRELTYEDVVGYEEATLCGDVIEYFAHDEKFIYYAVTFEQTENAGFFAWCWQVGNTFNIFNDVFSFGYENYYGEVAKFVLRGSEQGQINCSTWPISSRPMPLYYPEEWDGELFYDGSRVFDEEEAVYTKTYEIKMAKTSIMRMMGYDADEIRVIPYNTFFTSNAIIGAPLTEELRADILEANEEALIPETSPVYWFLVLDENPYPYPPGVTEPPVTEATTTEEATAEEPTAEATTAPETTAIATTAAPTTAAAEQGCKSSLALGTVALVPAIICGVVFKKKED